MKQFVDFAAEVRRCADAFGLAILPVVVLVGLAFVLVMRRPRA